MGFTARPTRADVKVGYAPQTAQGSVASVTVARGIAVESFDADPDRDMIYPQGTTGTLYQKNTTRHVTKKPKIRMKVLGAAENIGVLMQMMSFGPLTTVVANCVVSAWSGTDMTLVSISGIHVGFNTEYTTANGCRLYFKMLSGTITVYRDAAKTLSVATGTYVASTNVTLTATNSSGLTIVVACGASVSPANETVGTTTITRITPSFANMPATWWTWFKTDSNKSTVYPDCVMNSIRFTSDDRGALYCEVELYATDETVDVGIAVPAPLDQTVFAHNGDLVANQPQAYSTAVPQEPLNLAFEFNRDLMPLLGVSSKPLTFVPKLINARFSGSFENTTEVNIMIAGVDTHQDMKITYTNGAHSFSILANKVFLENPKYGGFSAEDAARVDLSWKVCEKYDQTTPEAAVVLTYNP